jgi:cell division septum initiation protein DivIVA
MAKALFGHVASGPDSRMLAEMRRLRQRVQDLEAELEALRMANASLISQTSVADELISLAAVSDVEPALTG